MYIMFLLKYRGRAESAVKTWDFVKRFAIKIQPIWNSKKKNT